ncbi:MAG: 4-hydroxybenzoyl-CoA reductase subunit beta [Firmicutes bacterium ADurb.Bin182]|nr:MAG: 4-hydroxybenzoyl-CoA reductase subunit beta [Firmicutes bacterium ADurb.Bin182]
MIPFHFDYYKPETVKEAVEAYSALAQKNKSPVYYGGGSELISMARVGSIRTGVVIDIKSIPECTVLKVTGRKLLIGSAVTLSAIKESGCFPLLGTSAGRIADHTNQCRITLGGNVCGTIIYRETVLPLLLADASVKISGPSGTRSCPFSEAFRERIKLCEGELITSFLIGEEFSRSKYVHVKKTKGEKIDYPLVTVAALMHNGHVRMAFSGVCGFPFRSQLMEKALNESGVSASEKAENAASLLPGAVLDNIDGSRDYRIFVLKNTVQNALEALCGNI